MSAGSSALDFPGARRIQDVEFGGVRVGGLYDFHQNLQEIVFTGFTGGCTGKFR